MELALAVMMVLGIFVAIPAVIGFAIAFAFVMADRRAKRARGFGLLKPLQQSIALTRSE